MELLKERIRMDGRVLGKDIIKVDSFLNHQLDPEIIRAIGQELANRFRAEKATKVLTIEASGIAVALMVGLELGIPVLFAKKSRAKTQAEGVYVAPVHSFTRGETSNVTVSARYLSAADRVLIIDDFLAVGEATNGLMALVQQAGAELVGVGIVVEKGFQEGGRRLREAGVNLHSLVIVEEISPEGIKFRSQPEPKRSSVICQ